MGEYDDHTQHHTATLDHDAKVAQPGTVSSAPENMAEELDASKKRQERFFDNWPAMLAQYTTAAYDNTLSERGENPENPTFEWCATMGAQFLAGVPQCGMRPAKTDDLEMSLRAVAIKHSINRWARDTRLKKLAKKLWVDWCLRRASCVISRRPSPESDRGPLDGPVMRPHVQRVSPKLLRYDSRALEWEDTLWRGHAAAISKKTLQRLARAGGGWRRDIIDALSEEAGIEEVYGTERTDVKRDDIVVHQVWFPDEILHEDYTAEDGFFGTLHWYAECEKAKNRLEEIKDPEPWFGPRGGPYLMSGQYYVPDNVEPLTVMIAMDHIARSMGVRAKVLEKAIRDYKRFIIEGTGTRNLGLLIKNVNHNGVIKAKGFNHTLAKQYETGGFGSGEMVAHHQWDSDRLEKRIGLTSTTRGETKPGVTATAEANAAGGTSARIAGLRDEFYDFMGEILSAAGELMDSDDRYFTRLPPEVAQETGIQIGFLRGGRKAGQSFEDYELWPELLSMKYRSEGEIQEQALMELEITERVANALPNTPWCDWKSTLSNIGDAYGIPGLAERMNYRMGEQVAGLILGQAIQAGQGYQPSPAQPRAVAALDVTGGRRAAGSGSPGSPGTAGKKPGQGAQPALQIAQGASPGKPMAGGRSSGAKAGAGARAKR